MTMMIVIRRSVFLFCAPSTIDLLKRKEEEIIGLSVHHSSSLNSKKLTEFYVT